MEGTTLAHTVDGAAELLSVSRRKIYTLMEEGHLPSFKLGRSRRISHDALVQFVKEREGA